MPPYFPKINKFSHLRKIYVFPFIYVFCFSPILTVHAFTHHGYTYWTALRPFYFTFLLSLANKLEAPLTWDLMRNPLT